MFYRAERGDSDAFSALDGTPGRRYSLLMKVIAPLPLLASLAFLLGSPSAMAGGSLGVEDLDRVLDSNPELKRLLHESIELGPVGDGLRLGRHFGENLVGRRIGPYEFPARYRGRENEALVLVVTLHTEAWLVDESGAAITDPGNLNIPESLADSPAAEEVEIRERLLKLEIRPATEVEREQFESAWGEDSEADEDEDEDEETASPDR